MKSYLEQTCKSFKILLFFFLPLMLILLSASLSVAQTADSLDPATSWYIVPKVGLDVYGFYNENINPLFFLLGTNPIPSAGLEAGIRRGNMEYGIIFLYGKGFIYEPQDASLILGHEIRNHWSLSFTSTQDWID